MAYPPELERLLPQAREVIRFLGVQTDCAAPLQTIIEGTGLSDRAAGKAIRQLVTRYYARMPAVGVYALTEAGQQAARDLRLRDEEPLAEAATLQGEAVLEAAQAETEPSASVAAGGDTPHASDRRQHRTLTVAAPHELVAGVAAALHAGLSAPLPEQPPLRQPARLIVRLSAEDCRVEPRDRPLEVGAGAAGPVRFRVTPQHPGDHHVKVEVFQLVALGDLRRVGGMVCDLHAADFPTPRSGEVATLGAAVALFVG